MIFQIVNPVITGLAGRKPEEAPEVFGGFLASLVGVLLVAGTIWTLVNLLQGGLQWISSGGDKAQLEAAQQRITNALIGLVILFASWAIFIVLLQVLDLSPDVPGGGFQLKLPTLF